MAKQYSRHRRSAMGPVLVALSIVLVAVVGGALLLHATGVINLPFLDGGTAQEQARRAPDRTGKVRVPRSVRPIPAYDKVIPAQHGYDAKAGGLAFSWLDKEYVPEDALLRWDDIKGRVIRHDKPAGLIFLEKEFFPKGTNPGISAGIPPGKRSMTLSTTSIRGLHGLQQGDRFDIVKTVKVELQLPSKQPARRGSGLKVGGPWAPLAEPAPEPEPVRIKKDEAEVTVIVNDGVVVKPVHQRQQVSSKPTGSIFDTTPRMRKTPVEEIIIAVDPDEVTELNLALAVEANLQVAVRSGQKTTEDGNPVDHGRIPDKRIDLTEYEPPVSESDGDTPVKVMEVIDGAKKRLKAIPRRNDEDDSGK